MTLRDLVRRVARTGGAALLTASDGAGKREGGVFGDLQRALLPASLPVLPAVDLAAGYLPAGEDQTAGGDWFDAVERDGKLLLVVGDVVGHGISAAATMGQLRAVLLDHLDTGDPIPVVATALDRWARHHRGAYGSTACLVELDPATGALVYITAGHPPPLVVAGTGTGSRFLGPSGHGPLGELGQIDVECEFLADGEVLVLYSDGLVELPGTTPMIGTVNLARAAQEAVAGRLLPAVALPRASERVARYLIERLVRSRGHTDDVTVLAVQRREPAPGLILDAVTDEAGVVARFRTALLRWLVPLGVRTDDLDALVHVVGELVQNVVDHAYEDGPPGPVRLRAALEPDGATVVVADDGIWTDALPTAGRGLGLAMVKALADRSEIVGGKAGTTVTVRHRLHRDVRLWWLPDVPPRAQVAAAADVWNDTGPAGPRVGASGLLDTAAAEALAAALAINTGPNHGPVTLDLRDVTLLGSAGVQTILRARAATPDLRIIAPAGSVAQHVLTLAAIPFATE